MREWIKKTDQLPPFDVLVEVKKDHGRGIEFSHKLMRSSGGGWSEPGSFARYSDIVVTHWRHLGSDQTESGDEGIREALFQLWKVHGTSIESDDYEGHEMVDAIMRDFDVTPKGPTA